MNLLWFFRYLFGSFLVFLASLTFLFFLLRVIPGDPALLFLGEFSTEKELEALRKTMGLDVSLWAQYIKFLKALFLWDFGRSFLYNESVKLLIFSTFPKTFILSLMSLVFSTSLSFVFSYVGILLRNTRWIFFHTFFVLSLIVCPLFVLAPYLIELFSIHYPLFSVGGASSFDAFLLPALSSGLLAAGVLTRTLMESLREELEKKYVLTAQMKGLSGLRVLGVHVLKNSLIPYATMASFVFLNLVSGALVLEMLFDFPGMGRLLYQAFQGRDFPLVQGLLFFIFIIYFIVHFLIEVLNKLLDKRVQLS